MVRVKLERPGCFKILAVCFYALLETLFFFLPRIARICTNVVSCCSSCRFLFFYDNQDNLWQPLTTFFFPSHARIIFVSIRVIRGKISLFRAPRGTLLLSYVVYCCSSCRFLLFVPSPARNPLLSYVVPVVVFSFPFRAMRGTYSCKLATPS